MILYNTKKFIKTNFNNEEEIEKVVEINSEYIFGPDSLYLPKRLIRSAEGIGTIPDGFAIDLSQKQWFIIEAELSTHSVWSHIAPQVSKQIIAASQPSTRRMLVELVVNLVRDDEMVKEKFQDLGIEDIDIRQVLNEIFESDPIVGIPIDHIGPDLRDWAKTFKTEVKLWLIRKLVNFDDQSDMIYEIPDEYRPVFDTTRINQNETLKYSIEDIGLIDLIEHNLVDPQETLYFIYKPRNGDQHKFQASVSVEGSTLLVDDQEFTSPSYAAVYCMQSVGSHRKTINGWMAWRTKDGVPLFELREELLAKLNRRG